MLQSRATDYSIRSRIVLVSPIIFLAIIQSSTKLFRGYSFSKISKPIDEKAISFSIEKNNWGHRSAQKTNKKSYQLLMATSSLIIKIQSSDISPIQLITKLRQCNLFYK